MNQELATYFALSQDKILLPQFVSNLILCILLSFILALFYERYGSSISDRKKFSKTFILLAATTFLVISIVKSSFALSLGLVGALSIVRYRGAIKEPEELTFLFLAIAIGLGFGANQGLITFTAFFLILLVVFFQKKYFVKNFNDNNGMILSILYDQKSNDDFSNIVRIVQDNVNKSELRRFSEKNNSIEAVFFIEAEKPNKILKISEDLKKFDDSLKVDFIDNSNIF